jgi:hypothetical protein
MKLLLPLLVSLLSSFARGQVTYVTVLYGNNVPGPVRQEVVASTGDLLSTLNETTPEEYDVVPAGAPLATRKDRGLSSLAGSRELDIGCPNGCSNSGSNYCRLLGCAYCGTCGGRFLLRGLQSSGEFDAAEVQSTMTDEVSSLCDGASASCELWTVVYVLNADGSLTEAT